MVPLAVLCVQGGHRLCPVVGKGHGLGFVIVWGVDCALLFSEVNGQALWSAGTSSCILHLDPMNCASCLCWVLCRLSGGATGYALQLGRVTGLPVQAGDRMYSTAPCICGQVSQGGKTRGYAQQLSRTTDFLPYLNRDRMVFTDSVAGNPNQELPAELPG